MAKAAVRLQPSPGQLGGYPHDQLRPAQRHLGYLRAPDARILRPTQALDVTISFAVDEPNPIDAKQRFTIWTLGGANQFPTQIQIGSQPAISPDGKQIAFIGKDDNVWVVNTDGSQATELTTDAEFAGATGCGICPWRTTT
jgi:hypothetical protein